jgi:tetratricopeptide (TPR) repeat protein/predicted aspartyl protease
MGAYSARQCPPPRRLAVRTLSAAVALSLLTIARPAVAACQLRTIAELPVTMSGLRPIVPVRINGKNALLIADSGAFFSMLTPASTARLGLRVDSAPMWLRVKGVNGQAEVGMTRVRELGGVGATARDVEFLVGGSRFDQDVDGLLGQNFLTASDVEFDLAHGVIRRFKAAGCHGAPLAYWAGDKPYSELDLDHGRRGSNAIVANARVNGSRIKVVFDSGAFRSILSLQAARLAGVDFEGSDVQAGGPEGGIGQQLRDSWEAPFSSFTIGGEEIQNTRLRISPLDLDGVDMLLGADFFLAHRILVSRSQGKIYFTYNGGPVFRLDRLQTPAPAVANVQVQPPDASEDRSSPKDAAGWVRQASAKAARGEVDQAISDVGQAIGLAPANPLLLFDRAQLQQRAGRSALALADLQAALKIDPRYPPALMSRGQHSLALNQDVSARADFEAAVAVDPNVAASVAGIYAEQGWFERSVELWDQWIAAHARDDRLPEALSGRCWARALWGRDLDKALADCDRAVRTSRVSSFLDSRGLVHLRLGQYDLAIADYTAALKDDPRRAWSLYGRGLAELRKGDKAQGDADLKAATAIAPDLPERAKRLGIA